MSQARPSTSGRKKARPSFNEYPEGRQPRGSAVKQEEFRTEINENAVQAVPTKEREQERRRKRLTMILVALCVLIVIIVIIIIVVSVMGKGDGEPAEETPIVDPECVINNQTSPQTFKDFECDLLTTLTTQESTFFRTFTSDTPYGKTIGWLTKEDKTDFSKTPTDQILERYVMALLYYYTEGNDWFSKYGFLSDKHVCNWNLDSSDIVRCADPFVPKKITDLALGQNNLAGNIPTEIGYLTQMTRLFLSRNQLYGKIPKTIGDLTGLEKLIPTEINQLTMLDTLRIESNDVIGSVEDLCDVVNATGRAYQFQADCTSKRIDCTCCQSCY
eukprot:scaffold2143_cov125-Cylindrotheca_fusiformis.AAC.14